MSYRVTLTAFVRKTLLRLPEKTHDAIIEKLLTLKENPRPSGVKKLQGRESWRVRVGDYRILYTIDDAEKIVAVFAIDHRRDVYR